MAVPEPAVLKTVLIDGAGSGHLPDFYAADAITAGTLVRPLPEYQDDTVDVMHSIPAIAACPPRSVWLSIRSWNI